MFRFVFISYLPSPLFGQDITQGQFFKQTLTGLNSEFSFSWTSCLTKDEERSLPYYLPIAGGRIIGFIPFPMVLVLCEMQSVSSRIWTRVAVSISCDDNHYTTGTSNKVFVFISMTSRWIWTLIYQRHSSTYKSSNKPYFGLSQYYMLRWKVKCINACPVYKLKSFLFDRFWDWLIESF